MVKVIIYAEGGGKGSPGAACRRGFTEFIGAAGFRKRMPKVVACHSREDAFKKFRIAFQQAAAGEVVVLLVDSEDFVAEERRGRPWDHLAHQDRWSKPGDVADERAHLMVQCMESWFLPDREGLAKFFGRGFIATGLPDDSDVEQVAKLRVLDALSNATRSCNRPYKKGQRSFDLLAGIDPSKVEQASFHAKRFFDFLRRTLGIKRS